MQDLAPLTLIAGLLLPWWTGYEVLRRLGAGALDEPGTRLRQLGNGFFIGYALMVLLVRLDSALAGEVRWLHVMLALLLVAIGARLATPVRPAGLVASARAPVFVLIHKVLFGVLLIWLLAHLCFNWIEIVVTPVLPWDAWAVWVYRAKAWFGQAALFEFMTPVQWLQSPAANAYSVVAVKYPWFASIMPLWAALSLHAWHETLVGLPVALLGPALALAFYGQLRALRVQPLAALVFCWFLVSTPLLAVHLSLAGYADIWMAGFTGLGFVAVLRFLLQGDRRQLLLGLTLLAIGATIKVEGLVWLFAGVLLLVLARIRARWLLVALGLLLAVVSLSMATGVTAVHIPGLGLLGVAAGALHLPYLGTHELVVNDLRWAFWDNAARRGSWHLAWLLILATFLVACLHIRTLRPVVAFLSTVILVLAAIFVFSDQGQWAQDYTAINRLPLQVYPALLFCVAVVWQSLARPQKRAPSMALTVFVLAISGLAVFSVALWLQTRAADVQSSPPVSVGPERLQFVLGGGKTQEGGLQVNRFDQGLALLSTGPIAIDASALYLLKIQFQYDWTVDWPEQAPAFFWRRADQPDVVSRRTLRDAEVFDLSDSDDWNGTIIEAGFVILQNDGQVATLGSAEITGPEPTAILDEARREWSVFEPWSQRSANLVFGGAIEQHLPLTLLVIIWILLSMAGVGMLSQRQGRDTATGILLVVLLGWVVLDARWTRNRLEQFEQSWHTLLTTSVEDRLRLNEAAVYHDWIRQLQDDYLGTRPRRVLLLQQPGISHYHARRAKYELLPHSVAVFNGFSKIDRIDTVDFILVMCDVGTGEDLAAGNGEACAWSGWLQVPEPFAASLEPLNQGPYGALLRVRPRPE